MSFFLSLLVLGEAALALPGHEYEPAVSDDTRAVMRQAKELGPQQLVESLQKLAASGDDTAAEFLGEALFMGVLGVAQDSARACTVFESIATLRPDAAHNLATCYYAGEGRPQDHVNARLWYRRAAEGGWTMSRCALGNMLIRGQGGDAEPEAGLELCLTAARKGNRDAQADVGIHLVEGGNVPRDPVQARIWLDRAATQGQANAAFVLAQVFERGDGTPANDSKAAEWYAKAHEAGRQDAAYQAARAYVRLGYRKTGDQVAVSPALLEKAKGFAEAAASNDPDADNRKRAAELVPDLETLIAKGRKAAD